MPQSPEKLDIPGLRDRGYIFVNGVFKAVLSRSGEIYSMPLMITKGDKLQILVENQGRVCYGADIYDRKGIISAVTLGDRVLRNWTNYRLNFDDGRLFAKVASLQRPKISLSQSQMTLWTGHFSIPCGEEPRDTFLSFDSWSKGDILVNGFNLGRYWTEMGPQMTLYLPRTLLNEDCSKTTQIIILEQDNAGCIKADGAVGDCFITSVESPVLNGPVPGSVVLA